MCGRMTLTNADWAAVADELLVDAREASAVHALPPRYNVAPTQPHPIVFAKERHIMALASWGFPGNDGGALVINARAETVQQKAMFRSAFNASRCVVVADGFLEWRKTTVGRQPLWFRRKDEGALYFAGLLRPPRDASGTASFVVLTTPPNHIVAPVHDRMPAVLTADGARAWLQSADLSLLRPAPDAYLTATPVSSRVNNAANDDAACLVPQETTRAQLSLF